MVALEIRSDLRLSEERKHMFAQLYEHAFPKVAIFVAHRGGSFEDAKDVFHDALVILYEKMQSREDEIKISVEFYLVGIAKHLWIRKFKDDSIKTGLEDIDRCITIPEDYFDASENKLTSLLALTGRRCMELLRAFYFDELSLSQVKSLFGFSTAHSASAQKFKCINKMRDIIRQKSIEYGDLK